jgi:hypothetical protein
MAKEKQKQPTQVELALNDAQALLDIWLRIKAYFVKAASEEEITAEDEKMFLDLKSEVQRLQRLLKNKMVADLTFGEDKMQELLRQSISIRHLRELPRMDRQLLINSCGGTSVYQRGLQTSCTGKGWQRCQYLRTQRWCRRRENKEKSKERPSPSRQNHTCCCSFGCCSLHTWKTSQYVLKEKKRESRLDLDE